jgi:hypothetical protein
MLLTSALVGDKWLASCPVRITPGERDSGMHCIRGCVDPRINLYNAEEIKSFHPLGLELQPLCHPDRSQSLSRLLFLKRTLNNKEVYRELKAMVLEGIQFISVAEET